MENGSTHRTEDQKKSGEALITAGFIGFLMGIIIYSIIVNAWGLSMAIPLFLIYTLRKKNKKG